MSEMNRLVSLYRAELMGIATIMILLGHSVFYGRGFIDYGLLQEVFTMGYGGVDIFLFLSGYGLVYSIRKNSVREFYRHRLKRTFPSVLAIVLCNILVNYKHLGLHFLNPLYWFGCYWFIGFVLVAYLLFPILHKLIGKMGMRVFYGSLLISLLLYVPFLVTGHGESNAFTCFVTRIPIFVMGACFSMGCFDKLFSKGIVSFMSLLGLGGLIPFYVFDNLGGNSGINTYYVLTILTPPYCMLG